MALPPDFPQTGLHVARTGDTPITRYQVIGERSSGTNFVKRLLGRNTPLKPTEDLGWKHGFTHMMAIPSNLAVIVVVRRADTWARSMFSKPWHTTPAMQAMTFSEFIRAQWDTIIDRPRYFEGLVPEGSVGQPLQHDRHPATGAHFETLFALRTAKLNAMLSLLGRGCTCAILRMEDTQDQPQATLAALMSCLGAAQPHAEYRPVIKRLGSKFKPAVMDRPALPDTWSDADMDHLRASIDTDLEARLGYTY
ncbi:hypothetical protein GCM10007385_13340 [Tateyamaria omphalii]|uniref:hypothetical protein n=1 Tax=Tateyamaria omphalii TaxID=299262 RepID=UPI001677318A|nr:hypothetical protein [Tateyamaria omphalii]GGX46959.1 hypothetical protein GCM10007385_13340 [Tateyamaria omphalii]